MFHFFVSCAALSKQNVFGLFGGGLLSHVICIGINRFLNNPRCKRGTERMNHRKNFGELMPSLNHVKSFQTAKKEKNTRRVKPFFRVADL